MSCFKYVTTKDSTLTFKCMACDKSYDKKLNEDFIKRFESTYRFCDESLINCISSHEKVFICMNTWIARKESMKYHFPSKKNAMATEQCRKSQI